MTVTVGICVRLKQWVEKVFPHLSDERRKEVETHGKSLPLSSVLLPGWTQLSLPSMLPTTRAYYYADASLQMSCYAWYDSV